MFNNQINNMFAFIKAYKKTEWFEQQVFEIDKGKRKTELEKKEKSEKKKRDNKEKRKANERREAIKLAKRAKDVIALERFNQIQATEAATKRQGGDIPETLTQSFTLQPKAKCV